MKLNCAVCRDLYVLYEENEISPEVKGYVEEHLKECPECSNIYKSGRNLPDVLEDKVPEPSKKLDEKLLFKLKLSRLRIALAFIAILIFMVLFNIYSQSRTFLVQDFQNYSQDIYYYKFQIDSLKTHEKVTVNNTNNYNHTAGDMLNNINKSYGLVVRNFNFIESRSVKKQYPNQCFNLSLTNLVLTLNNRWENGYWSEQDEEVYKRLVEGLDNLAKITNEYGNKLNSKYYIVSTRKLKESYDKLNSLANAYIKYNKLPEEVHFLTQNQLKERINYVLGENVKDIEFTGDNNQGYQFRVKNGKLAFYNGDIDALTGKITKISGVETSETSGNLIEIDKAKDKIKELTFRNLGEGFEVKIEYLGINVNYHSNVDMKVYCFKVQPTIKGYNIFSEINVNIDARTNNLLDYDVIGFKPQIPIAKTADLKVDIKYSPQEALKNITLNDSNKEAFQYKDTHFIKSMFSGQYVLVHYYKQLRDDKGIPKELYINTLSGKEEWPAYLPDLVSY